MTHVTDLPNPEFVLPGNRACAGCCIGIGLRQITAALEGRLVLVNPASCLTVFGGMFPISSVRVPWIEIAFPSTAASASGVAAGMRATGRADEMTVLAVAGKLLKPVSEYLATQSRFRGVSPETVEAIQAWVDARWARFVARNAGVCVQREGRREGGRAAPQRSRCGPTVARCGVLVPIV